MRSGELLEGPSNAGIGRIGWNSHGRGLEILAGFDPSFTFENPTGVRCTVWGGPSHPDMPREEVAAWILGESSKDRFGGLCRVLGPFAAFIDDPHGRLVTLVTDPLGLMPVFLCEGRDHTLVATDVWTLAERRTGKLDVDPRSLASWLWFGFNCSSHGLFEGTIRLPPGSVTRFEPGGRTSRPYSLGLAGGDGDEVRDEEIAPRVRDRVRSTTASLLRDRPDAIIALSGGWDSRLIAACAVENGSRPLAVSVSNTPGEERIAVEVAQRLGLELEVIRPAGEVFDLYDRAFGLTPSGYPITRFVTHEIARRHPGRPLLNGFLGDSLVRGSHDRVQGKLEWEHTEPVVELLMRVHSMTGGFHLLDRMVARHVYRRAREPMSAAVEEGRALGRIFQWVDLTIRQRFYIANNFLQHLDMSEPLLPFYDLGLIRLKLGRKSEAFGRSLYLEILEGLDPPLARIPHSGDLRPHDGGGPSRRVRRMASYLATRPGRLVRTAASARRAYPRLLAASVGRSDMAPYVKYVYAMHLLEARLESAGVDLDWQATLVDESAGR